MDDDKEETVVQDVVRPFERKDLPPVDDRQRSATEPM